MSREIKFRGKRVDNGEWVYGYLVKNTITTRIISDFALVRSDAHTEDSLNHCSGYFDIVDTETVGQLMPTFDKDGKEVFEGDIVNYMLNFDDEKLQKKAKRYKGFIKWNSEHCAFNIMETPEDTNGIVSNAGYFCAFEVIGNVYDNPELIKAGIFGPKNKAEYISKIVAEIKSKSPINN